MDSSCAAALLDVARPALPPGLVARLLRWDELDEAERIVARGDLKLMAAIMRMTEVRDRGLWETEGLGANQARRLPSNRGSSDRERCSD